MLERLGNVVVLERPLNSETLRRAVASSLRARARQYESRRHLAELIEAQEALVQLNDSLESRIAERTQELASANNRLMMEIHERAKVQAVLVQSQKMEALGQLTGGIAHDFNNLLNVIMVNSELIARVGSDDRIRAMAATVKRATERGAKLTGQLLTFSRNSNLDLKAVDVVALLQGMRDIITVSLGSSIRYTNEFDGEEMWTQADANQLELAILNLAINARDAMPDGGQLAIHVKERVAPDETLERRPLCRARSRRHRLGRAARCGLARVRSVLHDQADRQGHGPRLEPGLRHRAASRRHRAPLQRRRRGHHGGDLAAACASAWRRRPRRSPMSNRTQWA